MEKYSFSEDKAENLYSEAQALANEKEANNWISSWPGFASRLSGCQESNDIIKCSNGIFIKYNESTGAYNALIQVQDGVAIPQSLVYIDRNTKTMPNYFIYTRKSNWIIFPWEKGDEE